MREKRSSCFPRLFWGVATQSEIYFNENFRRTEQVPFWFIKGRTLSLPHKAVLYFKSKSLSIKREIVWVSSKKELDILNSLSTRLGETLSISYSLSSHYKAFENSSFPSIGVFSTRYANSSITKSKTSLGPLATISKFRNFTKSYIFLELLQILCSLDSPF